MKRSAFRRTTAAAAVIILSHSCLIDAGEELVPEPERTHYEYVNGTARSLRINVFMLHGMFPVASETYYLPPGETLLQYERVGGEPGTYGLKIHRSNYVALIFDEERYIDYYRDDGQAAHADIFDGASYAARTGGNSVRLLRYTVTEGHYDAARPMNE